MEYEKNIASAELIDRMAELLERNKEIIAEYEKILFSMLKMNHS